MTHVVATWSQSAFRLRNDDGSQTAATWIAATNTNATISTGVNFRIRLALLETAGGSGNVNNAHLQYNLAGGGWLEVTTTTPVQLVASAFVADGTATTQQITTGTFVSGTFDSDGTVAAVSFAGNDRTEFEYSVIIDAAQVSNGQTVQFRIVDGTSPFTTYAQTPTVTIDEPAAVLNRAVAITAASTVSAVGLIPATLENTAFRGVLDDVVGAITAQTPIAAVDTNWGQARDVPFHVAMVASETSGGTVSNIPLAVQFRINGGAWTDLSTTTPIQATVAVNCTTADATNYGTISLATGATVQRAQYDNNGGTSGTETLSSSSFEYTTCMLIDSGQTSLGDTIELRLTNNGTAFDADTSIPSITVGVATQFDRTVTVSASSTSAAVRQVLSTLNRTVLVEATSSSTASGGRLLSRAVTVVSSSTSAASAFVSKSRAVAVEGSSTLNALAVRTVPRAAAISASGSLTAGGSVIVPRSASIVATSSSSAVGSAAIDRSVVIASASALSVAYLLERGRSVSVIAEGTLTANRQLIIGRSVSILAESSISAVPAGSIAAAVSITASSTVQASSVFIRSRSLSVSSVSTLSASFSQTKSRAVVISAVSSIGVSSAGGTTRVASIAAASSISVNRTILRNRSIAILSSSAFVVSSNVLRERAINIACVSTANVIRSVQAFRAFVIAATSSLEVSYIVGGADPAPPGRTASVSARQGQRVAIAGDQRRARALRTTSRTISVRKHE